MRSLIGHSGKISLQIDDKKLFFMIKKIIDINETHITFIDKYGETFCFRIKDIVELNGVDTDDKI